MSRLLKAALSVNLLRKELGFSNIFAAAKFDLKVDLDTKIAAKNALVLSPSPDDDAFGMGAAIKKMTVAGTVVTVAYFCDGSGGVPEGRPVGEEVGVPIRRDENLIELRKKEAEVAAKILGISETVFFGYPDGKLAAGTSAIKATSDLIARIKPDIIFLPSFLDNHSDHRVVNEIFINACLAGSPRFGEAGRQAAKMLTDDFPIWCYEIWTPLFANRILDISLYIKTKTEAIVAHQSQLKSRRYDKAIVGLNQYRAEINNLRGCAEAFFASPLNIYRELYRKS